MTQSEKTTFKLTVKMISDWHIGSGKGEHAGIDAYVERDKDGLPDIFGRSLRGNWRDAAEQLAYGLDGGVCGSWSRLLDVVFGSQATSTKKGNKEQIKQGPIEGLLKVETAYLPEGLRQRLIGKSIGYQQLRKALTFAKASTAIDNQSGMAEEKSLRQDEIVRQGCLLSADITLDLPTDKNAQKAVLALLLASIPLLKKIGKKKKRGLGSCTCSIREIKAAPLKTVDDAITFLEKNEQAPDVLINKWHGNDIPTEIACEDSTTEWTEFDIQVKTLSPVVIAKSVLGNVVTGHDFIPGTYFMPFAAEALKTKQFNPWSSIIAGDIQLLPAFIEVDGQRGLSMPLMFEKKKEGGESDDGILSIRKQIRNTENSPETETEQHKPVRGGYIAVSDKNITYHESPETKFRTHNVIDDKIGRPSEEVGGVYSYEGIASGQILHSVLRIKTSLLKKAGLLQTNFYTQILNLGRAHNAGYGRCALRLDLDGNSYTQSQTNRASKKLVIWFTSDILVRDKYLAYSTTVADLCQELGLDAEQINQEASQIRVRRIESWQARWGLPRPSLVAVQAGSCLVFKEGVEITQDLLTKEAEGIGERRGEGYGQFQINPPFIEQDNLVWKRFALEEEQAIHISSLLPLEGDEETFAEQIEMVAWQTAIREAVTRTVEDAERRKEILGWEIKAGGKNIPGMSQLGAMRTMMGSFKNEAERTALAGWFDKLVGNSLRSKKWGDALDKTSSLIEMPQNIWQMIETEFLPPATLVTTREDMEGKRDLQLYAIRIFLLAAMRQHKRALENGEKAGQPKILEDA